MRRWLLCLLVPGLLLAACDGDSGPPADEDPLGALIAAFEETANDEEQTITFTIASTPESLVAASAEEDEPLSPEMAETVLGSSVSVSARRAEDPADQSARLALEVPNTEGAEFMLIGQDLYARADVRGIADAFEVDTAPIDEFLAGEAAQQFPFIESAVNGEFIKVEGTDQLTGSGTEQLTAQQEQLLDGFTETLRETAEVTFEGEDDVGDHFTVSAPLQALAQRFAEFSNQLGAGLASPAPTDLDVPEGDVTFDAWVSDGRVAQIEVDTLRLAEEFGEDVPEGVEQLAIRAVFSDEAEELSPPEDAVTVTGEQIMGLIFSGAFGGDDFPTETEATPVPEPTEPTDMPTEGFDCSVYEDLPPETFEGLPQETLDQLEQICPGIVPDQ